MENEIVNLAQGISDIAVDAHFDFKLDGWPASAVLITLCLSGVMIYGIKVWGQTMLTNTSSAAS